MAGPARPRRVAPTIGVTGAGRLARTGRTAAGTGRNAAQTNR
jgi:hypothetical protein